MALQAGDRIGPYEVITALGEGGMGVVFRARDSRLNRDVALKVLPDSFANDPDRLARFQREAHVLAALNHANIAAIYGIEEAAGQRALVMELVEGVDLTEAIRSGRFSAGEGLADAKTVALQIASALEAAHEAGVVHRDLKPANIKLRPDGTVKVLDFGLARTIEAGPGSGNPSNSPTMTTPAMTQAGMIMGTAAYMSPEQARGRAVDRRADIWAFGCVLMEMLTGTTVFARDSVTDTLAAITRDEPDWKSRPDLPPPLVRLIRRCLDKDPRTRLRDIGEARIALSRGDDADADSARLPAEQPRSSARLAWIVTTALVAIAASVATWWWVSRSQRTGGAPELAAISRVTTDSGLTTDPAVAPGGTLLAYASDRAGGSLNIWVQPLPDGQPVQVTHGQVDASEPAFSPDGSRIAYRSEINGGGIYVVPALGGTPRFLVARGRQPKFSPDGKRIAYVSGGRGAASEIWVIDAEGGTPRRLAPDLNRVATPVWSPDGRFIATTAIKRAGDSAVSDWWLVDPNGGTSVALGIRDVLNRADADGVPEAWGHGQIVYTVFSGSLSSLWAIAVSADGRPAAATPRRITAGVDSDVSPAIVMRSEGLTIYYANRDLRANIYRAPVTGVSSDAGLERLTDAAAIDAWPSVSSDGRTMIFGSSRLGRPSVWVRDLVTGKESPLTASGGGGFPTIGTDGKRFGFAMVQSGLNLGFRAVEGGEIVQRPEARYGWSWPRETMFFASRAVGAAHELVVLNPLTGQVRPVLSEMKKGFFGHGHLSPDGRSASAMEFISADTARIVVFPFGETPATPADVVPLTGEQTVEEEHAWSPKGDAIYFVSERDGTRCFWKQKLDPATQRPVGSVEPVLHLHGARRSMISTVQTPQRFVLHDGKLYFSMQEARANIWKATLRPRP